VASATARAASGLLGVAPPSTGEAGAAASPKLLPGVPLGPRLPRGPRGPRGPRIPRGPRGPRVPRP